MLMRNKKVRRPGRLWAPVVRSSAFVRKEIVEILRQPRLLALLVAGPFVLLLLFGAGYSQQQLQLRTLFVGPTDSIYEEILATYEDDLGEFIESAGYVSDEGAARGSLADGDVDVVVVFPPDPMGTVMAGERAIITVLHDEIDPIQQTAIEVAARLAIQEVNATVLSTLAAETQDRLLPASELANSVAALAEDLEASGGTGPEADAARAELDQQLADLRAVLDGSSTVLGRLASGDDTAAAQLDAAQAGVQELRDRALASDTAALEGLGEDAQELAATLDQATALDPDILVRPFDSETDSVLPRRIDPTDYFTPSSLALLLQHLALTFAALSLVRDRRTGLFELLRVGPLNSTEILVGKTIAYSLVGFTVAGALVAASTYLLDVPFEGEVAWMALVVAGVVVSSIALGMVLSALSGTESQAVQFAMLSLLAGLFFSGFILTIDDLAYPVKVISWLLPVTYGIRSFQDVMLRGVTPALEDLAGLAALTTAYGAIAIFALRRKLRSA
jgi:ABC-2 type transport system permease protein